MRHVSHVTFSAALLLGVALAGCATPSTTDDPLAGEGVVGGAGGGGGAVNNVAPTVTAFSGSLATADNSGSVAEVFSGTVRDANGEVDLRGGILRVVLTGPVSGTFTHTITALETQTLAEPANFGADGFKVWSNVRNDGLFHFKFRYVYPLGTAAGSYAFTPGITSSPHPTANGPADATTVQVFSEIQVSPKPVTASGAESPSAWGAWTANPGATNVEGTTYVKLVNTGQKATASVVLDFTEDNFTGPDANFTIPIRNNVEFAWWEDATPSSTAPSEGTYSWLPANADGTVTLTFNGLNNVIYVKYRVKQMPEILAAQSYSASFTATEL